MNHVFRWAVAAVSVIILTVVLVSNAKAADSVGLELESTVSLKHVDGNKYQASSTIKPKGECQYGYRLSLKLEKLALDNKHYIDLATDKNQAKDQAKDQEKNVWGYSVGNNDDELKSEGIINGKPNKPVTVIYKAKLNRLYDLPAGNYSGEVQYTITAKPAPEPVVEDKMSSWEYRDGEEVQASVKGENLFGIKSVELFDQSDKPVVSRKKEDNKANSSDGTSITFDFGNLSTGRYFATVYSVSGKSYKIPKPLVVWPKGDCVSGNSEYNKCKVILPQSKKTKFIPVVPSGDGLWTVVADVTGDNSQFGEWYDYDKKHWANILEVSNDKYDEFNKVGKQINDGEYKYHWTYLPRYAYEVQRRDATDKPATSKMFDIKIEALDAKIKRPQKCNGDNKDYRTECGVSRKYENQSSTWATHPAFSEGEAGVWFSFDRSFMCDQGWGGTLWDRIYNCIKDKNNSSYIHVGNNREWGALAYLTLSNYGAGDIKINDKCFAAYDSSTKKCWSVSAAEAGENYLVAATNGAANGHAVNLPGVDYYEDSFFDYIKSRHSRLANCTFETCGGQALYEISGNNSLSNKEERDQYDFTAEKPYWMYRGGLRVTDLRGLGGGYSDSRSTFIVLPVKSDGTAMVEKELTALLTAPQRLQPQLKAAQSNRVSEQASSVKLEASQQVGTTEATKTSERPTARPLDQQLSPAVRNRTEVTTNHAVVDNAIPQVKRQRQAVATGPVLRSNGTGGQTNLVAGQSPVAGVLGTEQNFVKQGLTHASSLMTAE